MIYLIENVENGTTKIGWSKHPYKRLGQLQTGNSDVLRIVKIYDNVNQVKERYLHRALWQYRCRFNSEWFRLNGSQLIDICDELLNHSFQK